MPQEQLHRNIPQLEISGRDRACSGCFIPLLSELLALGERKARLKEPLCICLGDEPYVPEDRAFLFVGDCASAGENESISVCGCSPTREDIRQLLDAFFE